MAIRFALLLICGVVVMASAQLQQAPSYAHNPHASPMSFTLPHDYHHHHPPHHHEHNLNARYQHHYRHYAHRHRQPTKIVALDRFLKRKHPNQLLGRHFLQQQLMNQRGPNKFLRLSGKEERDVNGTIALNKAR